MKRVLALVATSAVVLAAPMTVEGKKPPPLKITFKSWQVIVNDSGNPINVGNNGTFDYCPVDAVTHIYAIGKANKGTKGRKFSVTWKYNGEPLVTLGGYKVGKNGKVLAALHRSDNGALDDGTYTAAHKNKNGTTRIKITLRATESAC